MRSVGLLIPASNTVMEGDLHRELDSACRVHTARMLLSDVTAAAEQRMLDDEAMPAAQRIAAIAPELVVFGCTSAGTLHDHAYDVELRGRLAESAGAPVLGVMPAVHAELGGRERVALFTPYVAELTDRIAVCLEEAGYTVVARHGLGLRDNAQIGSLAPEDIAEAVTQMELEDAEAVFCSCTNLRAYEALPAVRETTGLPVVSSNQAVVAQVRARLGEG
jgi:maleate isomerase